MPKPRKRFEDEVAFAKKHFKLPKGLEWDITYSDDGQVDEQGTPLDLKVGIKGEVDRGAEREEVVDDV